jgi:hypothetical protein
MFSVTGLLAEAKDKELKTVRLIAAVGGSAVGEPIEMEASVFVRAFVPAAAGSDGRIAVVGALPLGSHELSSEFPALKACLLALGAGSDKTTVSGKELAAYAAVILEGEMATNEADALTAGEAVEKLLQEKCSPHLTRLRVLHDCGAIEAPRPAVAGRAIRQLYFPTTPASSVPMGALVGVHARKGMEFAETLAQAPPPPPPPPPPSSQASAGEWGGWGTISSRNRDKFLSEYVFFFSLYS